MKLAEIAALVKGTLVGDGSVEILDARPFPQAGAGHVTFWNNEKKTAPLLKTNAEAVLLPTTLEGKLPQEIEEQTNLVFVEGVSPAFTKIATIFHPPVAPPPVQIHPRAILDETAEIGENVTILANVTLGTRVKIGRGSVLYPNVCILDESEIGEDCVLFPNVTLYPRTKIGNRCILHAGAVLGAYGFGYDSTSGRHILSAQLGNVEVGDDVEIGANTTVDRATFGTTRIETGTKIDNLVMVGHNCQIGPHNLICSQVGIAGSTSTGSHVVCAGQVGIADHVEIGSDVILGAQAGVPSNVLEPGTYLGTPAGPIGETSRQFIVLKQLPALWSAIKRLVRQAELPQK